MNEDSQHQHEVRICGFCGLEKSSDVLFAPQNAHAALCIQCMNALITKRDYTRTIVPLDVCGLCSKKSTKGFRKNSFAVCFVCVIGGRTQFSFESKRHVTTELLIERRSEITRIFSAYGDIKIGIAGSGESEIDDPDIEIFVNQDLDQEMCCDVIVLVRRGSAFTRHPFGPEPVHNNDSLGIAMEISAQLSVLFDSSANITTGLTRYPLSKAKFGLMD